MGSNILSIGKSALSAAQVGLSTAGHNIANAATPGYNRQVAIQSTANAQNLGFGFMGQGVQVTTVLRVYNEFLNNQVVASQTAKSALDTYHAQISRIDNLLADTAAGLSPALQGFFKDIQDLTANPNIAASRQAMLSGAQTLAARFQSLDSQLTASREDVNSQITASVTSINAYARQIAQLNDAIQKASVGGQPPNDLLDQRDQVIADLNKEVKATVVKQDGNSYGVSIGNGQPLVLGTEAFSLTTAPAPDDAGRLQVGYLNRNGSISLLPESTLAGGKLGGLFEFRSQTLDVAQNALGRVAIGLATDFNAQHMQGVDQNGDAGGKFFAVGQPAVSKNKNNTGDAAMAAAISDPSKLTTSNYRLQYDGSNYKVTRLSDGAVTTFSTFPQTIDGVDFSLASGTPAAGDSFLIKPTANGAEQFKVLISDTTKIAAAGAPANPVLSSIGSGNTGNGAIQVSGVDASYAGAPLQRGETLTLKYDALATPPGFTVTLMPAGTVETPVDYTDGATITIRGINFTISGDDLKDGDTFILRPNNNVGDNGNALKLGELQTKNTLIGGTASYQGAYSQLVSLIGNKTHELDVNRTAEASQLASARQAQQAESGVNLDEEAANIMRFQQAYQAAAKVMQTASTMFDTLLSLGR
ncbi:MAG TPA: flagellar hook-associated protein FlgK [Burkholderiaceae bacterium]|nr:flagellar hook-associated protein FlgK [Burkholderiaceae bacterium]